MTPGLPGRPDTRHERGHYLRSSVLAAGTDYHVPFGGRKGLSYGPREQSGYAREFYTIVKTDDTKP